MKVRFYCDVPEFHYPGAHYWAVSDKQGPADPGYTRVAFDVELPVKDPNARVPVLKAKPFDPPPAASTKLVLPCLSKDCDLPRAEGDAHFCADHRAYHDGQDRPQVCGAKHHQGAHILCKLLPNHTGMHSDPASGLQWEALKQ